MDSIEQEVRDRNPTFVITEGGETKTISPETDAVVYEAMIKDRTDLTRQVRADAATQDGERTRRRQALAAAAQLDTHADILRGTPTPTQQREALGYVTRTLAIVIRVLIREHDG